MRTFALYLSLLSICLAQSDFKNFVEENLPQNGNVHRIKWEDQFYWVKIADPSKGWISCLGKRIGAFLVPDQIIAPTPICGDEILSTEARRLKECEHKQGACARLIMSGKDWILVTDEGKSFEHFVQDLPTDQRLPYLLKGLDAILDLHAHHMVQGRASIKDLTLNDNQEIVFIDFAEDPETLMSFDEARTRDLVAYFMTTLKTLDNNKDLEQNYTTLFIKKIPADLTPLFKRLVDNTSWLGKIAHALEDFAGKDIKEFSRTHGLLRQHFMS